MKIQASPAHARAGQQVLFTVSLDDPDAPGIRTETGPDFGDRSGEVSSTNVTNCERYGPWDPPPRQPLHWTYTYEHTFANPGTYTVRDLYETTSNDCLPEFDPYASRAEGVVVVVVDPVPSTTSTTSTTVR